MNRTAWLGSATVVVAVAALVSAGGVASATGMAGRTTTPGISWGTCPDLAEEAARDPRQQCATIAVPMDYRKPSGSKITIAISRIAAANPRQRLGILLMNPGGPGGSGLDFPGQLKATSGQSARAVFDRYDLIGFDPRGVGHSTPVTCGFSPNEALRAMLNYPAPDGSIDATIAEARAIALRCAKSSGKSLPYITTANTARDMERIRIELGESRLSYYGTSYGTYLGAVYASLFPARTDRVALDSAVDPNHVGYLTQQDYAPAVALRFPDLASYLAGENGRYQFGTTPEQVTQAYLAFALALDRTPIAIPDLGVTMDGNLFRAAAFGLLNRDEYLPLFGALWRALSDVIEGHGDMGQVSSAARDAMGGSLPADNMAASYHAVSCGDGGWPSDVTLYRRNVAQNRKDWPLTAGWPASITPCAFWVTSRSSRR